MKGDEKQWYKENDISPKGEPWGAPCQKEGVINWKWKRYIWQLKWGDVQGNDTKQKEALALSRPEGEMLMINMSWITHTSGGSCSMCLSERLSGWYSSVGMPSVSKEDTLPFLFLPKAQSQAEGEYSTCCFWFHNSAPFTANKQSLFMQGRAFLKKESGVNVRLFTLI